MSHEFNKINELICWICLHWCSEERSLEKHCEICLEVNGVQMIETLQRSSELKTQKS